MKIDRLITKDYKGAVKYCRECDYSRPITEFASNRNKCKLCIKLAQTYRTNKILRTKHTGVGFIEYIYKNTPLLDMYNSWDRKTKDTKPTISIKTMIVVK